MLTTAILLALLLVASLTDWRFRLVYNWTTYPGALFALAANLAGSFAGVDRPAAGAEQWSLWGLVGIRDSLLGLLACGGVMLVCYVLFAGEVGGGDLKLIAMAGAFLGVEDGLEVLLWTFVLGGCTGLVILVWRIGAVNLAAGFARYLLSVLRTGRLMAPDREFNRTLRSRLFLAPSALGAVLFVRFHLADWLLAM